MTLLFIPKKDKTNLHTFPYFLVLFEKYAKHYTI
jgi:hypothetical protein